MKKRNLCLLALFCFVIGSFESLGCNENKQELNSSNNNSKPKTVDLQYNVEPFNGIEAISPFSIEVIKSDTNSVKITVDEDLASYLDIGVKDGILIFKLKKGSYSFKTLKATVSMPELYSVKLSGNCNLYSSDMFKPSDFKAFLSGASYVKLKLNTLSAEFMMSGASNLKTYIKTDKLLISTSGSSDVIMDGVAEVVDISASGSSNIEMSKLKAHSLNLSSTGSSSINIFVVKNLNINTSGSSNVLYTGEAATNISSTGSSLARRYTITHK